MKIWLIGMKSSAVFAQSNAKLPEIVTFRETPSKIEDLPSKKAGAWRLQFKNGERAIVSLMGTFDLELGKKKIQGYEETLSLKTAPKVEPYFGKADTVETCDATKRPAAKRNPAAKSIESLHHVFATNQGEIGTCSPQLDVLKGQVIYLLCQDQSLVEIKYFYPRKEEWRLTPVATCRS